MKASEKRHGNEFSLQYQFPPPMDDDIFTTYTDEYSLPSATQHEDPDQQERLIIKKKEVKDGKYPFPINTKDKKQEEAMALMQLDKLIDRCNNNYNNHSSSNNCKTKKTNINN
uniref:Uncharacterized protein n=1 Tax=Plectus sambesii TaxID=2011161 RepID=A0A914UWA9_9BILA